MKLFAYLSVFLYLTSCTWSGVRAPNSTEIKGRHFVITLHGVRGNLESYGDFHKIVKENLEKIDPGYTVENFNWTYPVGEKVVETKSKNGRDLVWTPHHIAKKFNQDLFLGANAPISNMGPNDKISLIAYSMGGLMAMSWYYDTMFNFTGTGLKPYTPEQHAILLSRLEKVENVIGLGAVYWGSLDAELGWSFLENGNLTDLQKNMPQVKQFCESPEIKKVMEGVDLVADAGSWFGGGWFGQKKELTLQQKNEKIVKDAVKVTCLTAGKAEALLNLRDKISDFELSRIKNFMTSLGNVSPHELDNMRLTSDAINSMRIGRIKHLLSEELRNKFKAKWTSIVGVFPCMGKSDQGLTCSKFTSTDYKLVNDRIVTLFSGLHRRETDGPVISPSATADFLFYVEKPGSENKNITADHFLNTNQMQKAVQVNNKDIFVENMHATVIPALEAITGMAQSLTSSAADTMRKFDASLGVDVVIVDKECRNPDKCEHPNYKHLLQTLGNCEAQTGNYCDQNYMNRYFKVNQPEARMTENNKLKHEMGSFVLSLNIHLPKSIKLTSTEVNKKIAQYFKFSFVNYGTGVWGERRVDADSAPYGVQIGRDSEIMSSYSYLSSKADGQILRVFFIGRAFAKNGKSAEAWPQLEQGVPVSFKINIPGVQSRQVTAVVKPTYTTYVDMYMK